MCPGLLETRFYAAYGIPAFAYGPGLLTVSHGPERVRSNPQHCPMRGDLCAHGGGDVALSDYTFTKIFFQYKPHATSVHSAR